MIKYLEKNIDDLMDLPDSSNSEQLHELKDEIEIAHSEQKITETQFNLLTKKISDFEDKTNGKEVK